MASPRGGAPPSGIGYRMTVMPAPRAVSTISGMRKHKDPTWRMKAVFNEDEVETLISDDRIPQDRRALYALIFLGCLRSGEASARKWADWDQTREPLGAY